MDPMLGYDALVGDDPRESARALAAALRRQQAAGSILALTGDRVVAPIGQDQQRQAMAGQDRMPGLPQAQMNYRGAKAQEDLLGDPGYADALRALVKKQTPDLGTDNMSARALLGLLPTTTKVYEGEENRQMRRDVAQEAADARRFAAQQAADARRQAQQQRDDQRATTRWTQFGEALDPSKARAGEMAKVANQQFQADKLLALADQTPNFDTRQIHEFAIGLNKLLSGSSSPAQQQVKSLVPHTVIGDINKFTEWLSNKPQGLGQQEFVERMVDTVRRERALAARQMMDWQGKKASRYRDLHEMDKDRFWQELENWGLTPEHFDQQTFKYKGAPAEAPAGPVKIATDAEYEALPKGAEYIDPDGKRRRKK